MTKLSNLCPRCGFGQLKTWNELTRDEQLVAPTLPDSERSVPDGQVRRHRWCTKCWYVESSQEVHLA